MTRTFSQKFWEDKRGKVIVWQKPNIWLTTWFAALVFTWFSPYGWPLKALYIISLASLIMWAMLELTKGVNYFRRLVGGLVLLMLIFSHFL